MFHHHTENGKIALALFVLLILGGLYALPRKEESIRGVSLPQGYTLEGYAIEEVTERSCTERTECETPGRYLIQSRCPFVSLCLQNKCTVVCPSHADSAVPSEWQSYEDVASGAAFRYPPALTTRFISALDWPPKLQLLNEPFSCTEAGSEIARAGRTEKRMVDTRTYCVTKISEGAAGSVYAQYAYAFPKDGGTAIFTFSLRSVQCANYDEPARRECENERSSFDMDGVIDRIAETIVLK